MGTVEVVGHLSPLHRRPLRATALEGLTLAQIAGEVHERVHLLLDGERIERDRWGEIRPRAGQVVELVAMPAGGDDPTLAMIAITAAALFVPGAIGLAAGSWQAAALSAVIQVAGTKLIPTPDVQPDDPRILREVAGTRNVLRPYGEIPRPYGRHRVNPVVVGKPVTETVGNDQYVSILLAAGIGELDLSDLRLGEAPLTEYEDLEVVVSRGSIDSDYGGRVSLGDVTGIYGRDVSEAYFSEFMLDEDVPFANAPQAVAMRTTQPGTTRIGVEFVLPGGLFFLTRRGNKRDIRIYLKIEWSPAGAGQWQEVVAGAGVRVSSGAKLAYYGTVYGANDAYPAIADQSKPLDINATCLTMQQRSPDGLRMAVSWPTGQAGTWDVRVTSYVHDGWLEESKRYRTIWRVLRSTSDAAPVSTALADATTLVAIRARASDEIQGELERFSCVAHQRLPVWDGTQWTAPQPTRSPAWAFADALSGPAAARPVDRAALDVQALAELDAWAAANGFHYDSPGGGQKSVHELLREICSVARASPTIRDGLYTVVRDGAGSAPVQAFTPRNSRGFSARRVFADQPHALRVRFINPANSWREDERIVYADGYSADGSGGTQVATRFEELRLPGVTDADHAWRLGRYHLAQALLRPESYRIDVDVEHLRCARGDVVRVAHDVTLWGSGWGRVTSVTPDPTWGTASVTLDERVTMDGSSTYVARIRRADGTQAVQRIQTVLGETGTIIFSFTTGDAPLTGVAEGDLVIVGIETRESQSCIVAAIEPGHDLTATLTLVDEAPAILDADQGPIPPWDSLITQPLALDEIAPPVPIIEAVRSDESVLVEDADGSLRIRLAIWYAFPVAVGLPGLQVELRYRPADGGGPWRHVGPVRATGAIDTQEIDQGETYELQIRAVAATGLTSRWTTPTTETIVGKSTPPPDMTGLRVYQQGKGAVVIRCDPIDRDVVRDLDGALYRYGSPDVATWETATPINEVPDADNVTSASIPPGRYRFFGRWIDTSGNLSTAIASVVAEVESDYEEIAARRYDPAWPGSRTNFVLGLRGSLVPASAKAAADHTNAELFERFVPYPAGVSVQELEPLALGGVVTARVWGEVEAHGRDGETLTYQVRMELRWWDADASDWTDWHPWTVGNVTTSFVQARISLDTAEGLATITGFRLVADVREWEQVLRDVAIDAGGTTVTFPEPFNSPPLVTVQVVSGGAWALRSNVTAQSVDISVYDSSGAAVSGVIDLVAKGA